MTNNNLQKIRQRKGWTRGELAKRAGLTSETIRNLEKGERPPRSGTVAKLCKALKCSAEKIFPGFYVNGQISFGEEEKKSVNGLAELRSKAGMTQKDVAEKLNTYEDAVRYWENGRYHIPVKYMYPLCELYRCTLDELVKAALGEPREESPAPPVVEETAEVQAEEPAQITISEAVAQRLEQKKRNEEVASALEKLVRHSRDEEYTAEEIQLAREQGKTQGRKGIGALRINFALEPDNYDYVVRMSQACGMSMTEFVNCVLRKSLEMNRELYDKAKTFEARLV